MVPRNWRSVFLFPDLFLVFFRIVQLDADGAFFESITDIEDILRFDLEAKPGRSTACDETLDLEALQLEAEASIKRDDGRAGSGPEFNGTLVRLQ